MRREERLSDEIAIKILTPGEPRIEDEPRSSQYRLDDVTEAHDPIVDQLIFFRHF